MTLTYAKILDTTMRKSWEEVTKQGLFRIDDAGKLKKIDISDIENEDIIEWEYIRHNLDAVRMPLGYCMKPKKQECHTQLNPCLTCRNLCTTPEFIPQYELEIQETKTVIKKGRTQNRSVWVEKNQALLERYESVLEVLKTGKIHHKAGKKVVNILRRSFPMDSSTAAINRNTDGLKAFAQKKKEFTLQKVNEAIQRLIIDKAKVNFNSVSMESGVTKTYLYNNHEIRDRIETLRKQQEGLSSPRHIKREMTDPNKDILIAAKNKRLKELENENKRLKEELEYLLGKIYDRS